MNIGDIASIFIRAAEIDRNSHEHVGPGALRAQQFPYVHTWADKAGWRKEPGDKLARGEDPLSEERKAFWERFASMPTAAEIRTIEQVFDWLTATDDDAERRALWAWARAKAGGKSFRRWCFTVEGIHPETGRRRKDRALARIAARFPVERHLHDGNREIRVLSCGHDFQDVPDTIADDARGSRGLNCWAAHDAFGPIIPELADFSWAAKRNERRRQREARKRQKVAA